MSVLRKRFDFQVTTAIAGSTIQVRSIGFAGAFVLYYWNGRDGTIDAAGEASYRGGFGFASALGQRCVAFSSLHGGVDGENDCSGRTDSCIATIATGTADPQAIEGLLSFSGFVSDGFDLLVNDAFAGTFRVHGIVIGGTEILEVTIGTITGATGNVDVNVGYDPSLLVFLNAGMSSSNSVITGIHASIGMATGAAANNQFVLAVAADDSVATTSTFNYCRRGEVIAPSVCSDEEASVAAITPTGFRLNYALGAGMLTYYLAVRGGRFRVLPVGTQTVNGASVPITGAGFAPIGMMLFSGTQAESALGTADSNASASIGCATGTAAGEQACMQLQDKSASAAADCFTALDYDKIYLNADLAATQAVEGLMALSSFDGDGFTGTMTDGDPVSCFAAALLIGQLSASSSPDAAGLLLIGAPIRYFDDMNIEWPAYLASAQAAFGDTVDVGVLRVAGSTLVAVTITSVKHYSTAGISPYWTAY